DPDRADLPGPVVDDPAPEQPNLRRRKAGTVRVLHQRDHPLRERREVVVELLHLARSLLQDRVGELPHLRQRMPAALTGLGLAFLLLGRHAGRVSRPANGVLQTPGGYRVCGSTSTTTVASARRNAAAWAPARPPSTAAARRARSVF